MAVSIPVGPTIAVVAEADEALLQGFQLEIETHTRHRAAPSKAATRKQSRSLLLSAL